MTPENRWQKYRQWVIVIVAISITVVLVAWFLQLAPQYIPRFLFTSLLGVLIALFCLHFWLHAGSRGFDSVNF